MMLADIRTARLLQIAKAMVILRRFVTFLKNQGHAAELTDLTYEDGHWAAQTAYRHSTLPLKTSAVTSPLAFTAMWMMLCVKRLLSGPGPISWAVNNPVRFVGIPWKLTEKRPVPTCR